MTTAAHRVASLEVIARAVDAGEPLPVAAGAELVHAIREHLDSGRSLDGSIGLTRGEFESAVRTRRDRHLRDAAEHVAGDTPKARAEALAHAIARYQDARGRRDRDPSRLPVAEPARSIALADHLGALPTSSRHLLRILAASDTRTRCDVTGGCGMVALVVVDQCQVGAQK